ncbi:5'-nucleotidase C-terminal domain-containing protein [Myxococcus sp. K38C18041901]|uniref:5'-nucleotidase C-terminal domain-containing protein n=1 Tax=Myxococcus guangdongensis TaxID=2906760 RepID=UPI0020A8149E|nr:5'-nucleotidase [Myxococcus guangdongensis]MCP3065216.1 5'-nucleotidase C-terminal domain-containing protein [Myxococcus guangdongensis]
MSLPKSLVAALVCALASPLAGCISYNDSCQPLVADPDAVVGYLGQDVLLDKPFVWHDNNALAQAAADAFRHAEDGSARPAVLGVINGGSLRAEGLCFTRQALRKGPLTDGVLHEVILFENLVVSVDLTEKELVRMMENSVGSLYREGELIASPSGAFLHLSEGTTMHVNCASPRGQRVEALTVNGQPVPLPPRDDESIRYRVAMPSFLLGGGDGYGEAFGNAGQNPDRFPVQARKLGGTDANITSAYLRERHPSPEQSLTEKPRITFSNCARPARPAGG